MAYEAKLLHNNPWWREPRAVDENEKIVEREGSAVRYDPPLRRELRYNFEPDNTVIYTLGGPRQVGKTTMLMLQVRDLLAGGADLWNVFYYSFDDAGDGSEAIGAIEVYVLLNKKYGDGGGHARTCSWTRSRLSRNGGGG